MKKQLTLILAALLLASSITACGNGTAKETNMAETKAQETVFAETEPVETDANSFETTPSEVLPNSQKVSAADYAAQLLDLEETLFSCKLDGVPISDRKTERTVSERNTEDGTAWEITVTDTESGLRFVTTILLFDESNALELATVLYGPESGNSPVISEFSSVDVDLPISEKARVASGESIVITTARGCQISGVDDDYDFGQLDYVLGEGDTQSFAPDGGRSCHLGWPYFDVAGAEDGAILAIGWTGQWKADFTSVSDSVNVQIGQENFRAYLTEGERIITPTLTVLLYEGTTDDAINDWRQMYLNYYTPENALEEDFVFPIGFEVNLSSSSADQIRAIGENFAGIPLAGWMDAGWYGDAINKEQWDRQVGSWYPLLEYGEEEMKNISSALHEVGYPFILWFEPERAREDSEAADLYPELFYAPNDASLKERGYLLRLDTEEGYQWMYDLLSNAIAEYDVDIYRQDFNMNPLNYWLYNDEDGRVGITEAKYIENMWRLMDELTEAFPDLIIDNCASGGRRLDIGMMQRCISLFRTDYSCLPTCDPSGYQYHTQSINRWIPLSAAGLWCDLNDPYNAISTLSVGQYINPPMKYPVDLTLANQKYFYGDFYTLLKPTYDFTSHQAWEFYDRDSDSARVTLIARPETPEGDLTVKLKGLNPDQIYKVTVYGTDTTVAEGTGAELMTSGITYHLTPRTAVLLAVTPQT